MGLVEDLAADLGPDRVRPGGPDDAIGGRVPQAVAEPLSPAAVALVLARAGRDGLAVRVRGGGTKQAWSAPPARLDVVLSTRALHRLVDHAPGDMTCVAEAGMPLAALQVAISDVTTHRQRLMLDPPGGAGATLGGVLATAAAGPRRVRYGTPRDLVIGARYVTGDGLAAKTGGRVVKNVAGYDVAKLLIGSHGSLAVITEVALKLHPLPDAARTVVLREPDPDRAAAFCDAVRGAPVTPALVEAAWPEGLVLVRVESTAEGAAAQVERLRDLGPIQELDEPAADALAADLAGRAWAGTGPVLAVGVVPDRLPGLLRAAAAAGATLVVRAPVCAGELGLPDDDPERAARVVGAVRALGGSVQLRRGGEALRALVHDEPGPAVRRLEAALKDGLDPHGVLAGAAR
ncbi:MAG: FAD-binding oxidoreductase [Actinobacteria bacterium]|nr:FAD-binding oxidoreductase [Actinomycetota bacterium]